MSEADAGLPWSDEATSASPDLGKHRRMAILTNAHTHLELSGLGHLCPLAPVEFTAWLTKIVLSSVWRSPRHFQAAIEKGIRALVDCGVTHVGDISRTGLSIEPLLASGLHGVVWLEVFGLAPDEAQRRLEYAKKTIREARADPRHGPMRVGLAVHAPYSCHPELLRQSAAWCRTEAVPLTLHAAESPAELELFTAGAGPMRSGPIARLQRLRGYPPPVPKMRPVEYLETLDVLEAKPLLVHMVQVTGEEIRTVANAGCSVVHCPRSNHALSCGRMPLERYLDAGVTVYLGTDSRASSPSLDVREEAAFARGLHAGHVAPDAIEALLHAAL